MNLDGLEKNPSAVRQAVRQAHGPEQGRRTHGPEQSRRAALHFIPCPVKLKAAISIDMGYRSCLKTVTSNKGIFNRVNHFGVLVRLPHSSRFARLVFRAFSRAVLCMAGKCPASPTLWAGSFTFTRPSTLKPSSINSFQILC
jgi:hypothetical protein